MSVKMPPASRQITKLHLRQSGDTIVEVLISIAILSMILGGAYVTTNRSLRATRAAEERTTATKLVQGQLELIKIMMSSSEGAAALAAAPTSFCIVPNVASGAVPTAADASGASCLLDAAGTPTTVEPAYNISINQVNNLFTVTSSWNSILNPGKDNVAMSYRVYQ